MGSKSSSKLNQSENGRFLKSRLRNWGRSSSRRRIFYQKIQKSLLKNQNHPSFLKVLKVLLGGPPVGEGGFSSSKIHKKSIPRA